MYCAKCGSQLVTDAKFCPHCGAKTLQSMDLYSQQNSDEEDLVPPFPLNSRQEFYKFYKAFGFTEKTGIELNGETSGIFFSMENFNVTELATSSFGQGFQVTPLQMLTAISAVANKGNLMRPYVVKQYVDDDGNIYDMGIYYSENMVAAKIGELLKSETTDVDDKKIDDIILKMEDNNHITYNEEQKEAILNLIDSM